MKFFKTWAVSFISLVILDLLWIHWLAANFYFRYLSPLSQINANGAINFHLLPGIIVYALLALAFVVFTQAYSKRPFASFIAFSALLGFIIYAVFDFTNLSFMSYWPITFALADIVWGTVSFVITASILKAFVFKD